MSHDVSSPLPASPLEAPVRRKDALAAGVTPDRLRGPHWASTLRGVHRPATDTDRTPGDHIAEVALLLPPGAAIGGWASLWRQGVTDLDGSGLKLSRVSALPRSRAAVPDPRSLPVPARGSVPDRGSVPAHIPVPVPAGGLAPVLVCTGPGARVRPRAAIDISRRRLPDADVIEIDGVPYVRAERSLVDLAGRQPPELGLASLDAAIRFGATSAAAVHDYLLAHPGVRQRPQLLRIVELADGRVKSRPESVMRWIWVVEAGLPPPLVNHSICDSWGVLRGEPDLLDLDAGLVGEYDGAPRAGAAHVGQRARGGLREPRPRGRPGDVDRPVAQAPAARPAGDRQVREGHGPRPPQGRLVPPTLRLTPGPSPA